MSGAEVIAVLGVISSIISIVEGTKKIYDAATDVHGLPQAFREVAGRLPIVETTLDSTKHIVEKNDNNDSCKGVKHIVEACEEKAKKLEELFRKALPADGTSGLKRYYKAATTWGKGNEVETLMKGMLEDVQLLACERGMKTATEAQQEQIIKAIAEVSVITPSIPEHELQEAGFTNTNPGSGTQYNAQGEYIAQGDARQYISGGGAMSFGQTIVDVTAQNVSFSLGRDEHEAQTCLSALFLTDPRDDRAKLINTKGSRVDGTCKWIESHPLYISWLQSHSQLLWLSGGPGKGKTMLSIFLAEELEQTAKISQDRLLLQYFCDNKDEKRNTAIAVLRGLIYQLLQSHPKLFDHILPAFKIQKESLLSFETLWRIFESMVYDPTLGTTYCVLDGLDECDKASSKVLLEKFAALLSAKLNEPSASHLNLLIVSRYLPDMIPESLSSFSRISLDPDAETEIKNDIDLFIKAKVTELSRQNQYPETLRAHVEDVFRHRAQGTFLWIGIVANLLSNYKAIEVETALDLLPPGLDEMYARILLQIDSRRQEVAARILRWVVMAVRPLTLSELSVAIDTTVESSSIVTINRDRRIRDQVSYCGDFLTIEEEEVRLIHQSAKDYLLRKSRDSNPELETFRVKEYDANLEIARKCLHYLESGALANTEPKVLEKSRHLRAFPLLSYAVLHWHEHARLLARSEDIFDLSLPFYQKKSQTRMSWLTAKCDHYESQLTENLLPRGSWHPRGPWKSFTLLHLASYLGILPLAENLILKKTWIKKLYRPYYLNECDEQEFTALMWAAQGGYNAIVRLLLEHGANIHARSNFDMTAMMMAAMNGHEATVRLLLEKGADIHARDEHGKTALMTASWQGHEAMLRLLLEKGAGIHGRDADGMTALMRAAEFRNEASVRLLLETGADVEAVDEYGRTTLMIAAGYGFEAIVRLLLAKGADLEPKDMWGKTAMDKAVERGQERMVRLLTLHSSS